MTSDTSYILRRAAKELTERASRVAAGPWQFLPYEVYECGEPGCCFDWEYPRVVDPERDVICEFTYDTPAAEWVAMMDPTVGLAIAALLETEADECDDDELLWIHCRKNSRQVLDLARAILGEDDSE